MIILQDTYYYKAKCMLWLLGDIDKMLSEMVHKCGPQNIIGTNLVARLYVRS
jgi:hypothetical protein